MFIVFVGVSLGGAVCFISFASLCVGCSLFVVSSLVVASSVISVSCVVRWISLGFRWLIFFDSVHLCSQWFVGFSFVSRCFVSSCR